VVDLSLKLNREKWECENLWTPSKANLDAIADDIWKRKSAASPKLTRAKNVLPKPPSLTWDAKEAIREIQSKVWGIGGKLEHLAAPTLKSKPSRWGRAINKALWQVVSDTADLRHRTGQGIGHTTVESLRWDVTHHSGESSASCHVRHNSKAEEAARRMLIENAKYFAADMSVEASVVCDLE
jgi:hypothetical protein